MQDYMKALQKQFDRQEFDDLNALVEYTHEELKKSMDIVERKKLLRLLDAQNTLLAEARLSSWRWALLENWELPTPSMPTN